MMKITAIVGSYHRGGMVDSAVDEILTVAVRAGADVQKIHLLDRRIEFCTNCQACAQQPGPTRGRCVIEDDMASILDRIDASDAIILASPVNFWTVTALMKRFIERLICYGHWPWSSPGPRNRIQRKSKRAIVLVSCAAPAFMGRLLTNTHKMLRRTAVLLGARKIDTLFIGLARHTPTATLNARAAAKARRLGERLCRT